MIADCTEQAQQFRTVIQHGGGYVIQRARGQPADHHVQLDVRNLEFTTAEGDIAYLKYQMKATPIPAQDGRPRNLINGSWDVVGNTGKLKQLQGAGVLRVNVISPNERSWILEGELVQAP